MVEQGDTAFHGLEICEENILVHATARSREDIIQQLGALLYEHGFVRDSFVQAVLDREKVFPTGLQTNILGFAIPHTDTEHVYRPAIAIATLRAPVVFQAMGEPETEISVDIVMMLAISDPQAVVLVLRQVISILEDEEALQALTRASSPAEIKTIVYGHIEKMAGKMSEETAVEISHG